MRYAQLIKVSLEGNHNIEYKMKETDDGTFTIEIAAYGVPPVCSKRPMCLWDKTYNRKLSEGYVDRTGYCKISGTSKHAPIEDPVVAALWQELNQYSRNAISENYEIKVSEVSDKMLCDVAALLIRLSNESLSIQEFNSILSQIFVIMPRRMKDVRSMIAHSRKDIPLIVERENELFDMFQSQVKAEDSHMETGKTILESLNLEIRCCTASEEEKIKEHLHPETLPFFKRAYRVKNRETDQRFWDFYNHHEYSKRNIHYYYHGSRNENWLGIIMSGLKLAPKATKNGSMFGLNLYTAPKSDKSQKYTSLRGSFWAHGNSTKGFIAVYKVLFRNPRHIYHWSPSMAQINKDTIHPYDALYCHGGPGCTLRNDECVLPLEEQVTIQYLIELEM